MRFPTQKDDVLVVLVCHPVVWWKDGGGGGATVLVEADTVAEIVGALRRIKVSLRNVPMIIEIVAAKIMPSILYPGF